LQAPVGCVEASATHRGQTKQEPRYKIY